MIVVAALGAGGCEMVFGLHDRASPDGAVLAPDASAASVTGKLGWLVVTNDGSGNPLPAVEQLVPPSAEAVLDDGRQVAITTNADDSFSFPLDTAGQGYRFAFEDSLTPTPQEVDDSAAPLDLVGPLFGRIDRTLVTASTKLTITTAQLIAAPSQIFLASTGLRSLTGAASGTIASFAVDWLSSGTVSGPSGLPDASQGDRLFTLTLADVPASAATIVNYAAEVSATLTNGVAMTIPMTLAAVPAARCVTVAVNRRAEVQRVQREVAGIATGTEYTTWELQSTPFPALTPGAGLAIVIADNVAPAASTPAADTHVINYGNPFPHESEIALRVAFIGRTFTLPGTTGVIEYQGTEDYLPVPVSATCPGSTVTFATQVAIPSTPTLDGVPLDVDNTPVDVARDRRVPLTFKPAADGHADDFNIVLYEAYGNATNTTTLRQIKVFTVTTPELDLDPAELIVGKSYVFEVITRLGVPNAAQGDYATTAFPFGAAIVFSGIFRVAS